jgi:arginyl-tRNA synthetase
MLISSLSLLAGTAKFLSDILEAAQEQMLDRMKANEAKMSEITDPEKTADVVGVSAVVVQDFSAKRVKDYGFNLERATAAEGAQPLSSPAQPRCCRKLTDCS